MLLLINVLFIIRLRFGVRLGILAVVGSITLVAIPIEVGYLDLAIAFLLLVLIIELPLAPIRLEYLGPVWGRDALQGDVTLEL